jgi:hypothetical protein
VVYDEGTSMEYPSSARFIILCEISSPGTSTVPNSVSSLNRKERGRHWMHDRLYIFENATSGTVFATLARLTVFVLFGSFIHVKDETAFIECPMICHVFEM